MARPPPPSPSPSERERLWHAHKVIKYLGSKRTLVPVLGRLARASEAKDALDLFTGTTRVAQEFCRQGLFTFAADVATYSEVLAKTYVETDGAEVDVDEVREAIDHLESLPPKRGYFTRTFCEQSRYFQPKNGMRVDAIREGIDEHHPSGPLRPILLTSLMEAADAVDSTVGLQMAYLKNWAPRAHKDLKMAIPKFAPGTGKALRGDASELVDQLPHVGLAYLDPPYNQHRYFTNYHIWETLVRWDEPEHYGVACKRVDARDEATKSVFNKKREMPAALADVIGRVRADTLILSFSNEGFVPIEDLVVACESRGDHVKVLAFDSARHIGARIGIHNHEGEKVGRVSHTRNTEYLVLCGEKERISRMVNAV